MKKDNRVQELYKIIGEGEELTTKNLKSLGFSKYDLKCFVDAHVLAHVEGKRGQYTFCDIKGLFNYGRKMLSNNQSDQAMIIFEACLRIHPNHSASAFKLFFEAIKKRDYERAYHYLDILFQASNGDYAQDCRLYLFLLSKLSSVPEKYREIVDHLSFQQICVLPADKRFPDKDAINQIRENIFNQNYNIAFEIINSKERNPSFSLMLHLLERIQNRPIAKNLNYDEIRELIKIKKYDEVIRYFESKEKELKGYELLWFTLCKTYQELEKTHMVPVITKPKSINFTVSLENKDYEQALILTEQNARMNGHNPESRITYLILRDIHELTASIKEKNSPKVVGKELAWIKIKELVVSKNYEELVSYIESLEKPLTYHLELWMTLAKAYADIKKTQTVPVVTKIDDDSFKSALEHENYRLAFWMTKNRVNPKSIRLEDNIAYLILKDINELIASIKKKNIKIDTKEFAWIKVKELVASKNYEELISYIESLENPLTNYLEMWLLLAKKYVDIKKTQIIPAVTSNHDDGLWATIKKNDFKQAILLAKKGISTDKIRLEDNIDYLILKDINELIAGIKNNNSEKISREENSGVITIDIIYQILLTGDIENGLAALHLYLVSNHLERFERFIVNLIKLDVKEQDFTFGRSIQNLILLSHGYRFDVQKYKEYFYEALTQDSEEAKLYLEIILNLKKEQELAINTKPLQEAYLASRR